MYLLDTNLITELSKIETGHADPGVSAWAANIDAAFSYLSVVSLMELELGIQRIGQKNQKQAQRLQKILNEEILREFSGRILPISEAVAMRCASLHLPMLLNERDAWMGATALAHGLTLVTRNSVNFGRTNVPLINPWLEFSTNQ